MGLSLKNFETTTRANAGVEMELKDLRTGKGAGAYITLLGTDSDTFREIREERSRSLAERAEAGESLKIGEEERTAMQCDTLARCTKAWRGIDGEDGAPLPECSFQQAYQLYMKYPAIRDQANTFIAERSNFVLA